LKIFVHLSILKDVKEKKRFSENPVLVFDAYHQKTYDQIKRTDPKLMQIGQVALSAGIPD